MSGKGQSKLKLTSGNGNECKPLALGDYQKARVAFVNTVNDLLAKGDAGVDAALLEGNLLPLLYQPLVQGDYWMPKTTRPYPAPSRRGIPRSP